MKEKEKRKADKIKLIELMRFDARLQIQKEVQIINPHHAQIIKDSVFHIEKQVDFQKQLVQSLQKRLQNFLKLPPDMGKIAAAKLKALQREEELLNEVNKIGNEYSNAQQQDEDWVLNQENNNLKETKNPWDQINNS